MHRRHPNAENRAQHSTLPHRTPKVTVVKKPKTARSAASRQERSSAAIRALLAKGRALRDRMSHSVGEEWDDLCEGGVSGDANVLPPTTWGSGAFTPAPPSSSSAAPMASGAAAAPATAAAPLPRLGDELEATMSAAAGLEDDLDALVTGILAHKAVDDEEASDVARSDERGAVSLAGIGAKFETLGKVLHRVYAIRIVIRAMGAHAHRPGAGSSGAGGSGDAGHRRLGGPSPKSSSSSSSSSRYVAERWEVSYALDVPPSPEDADRASTLQKPRGAPASAFGYAGPGRSAVFSVAASRRRSRSNARSGWQMFAHDVEIPLLIDEAAAVRWINGDGKLIVRLACDGKTVVEATAPLVQLLVSSDLAFRAKCPVVVREKLSSAAATAAAAADPTKRQKQQRKQQQQRVRRGGLPQASGAKAVVPSDIDVSAELLLRPRDRGVPHGGRVERASSRPWEQPRYRAHRTLRGAPSFGGVAARPSPRKSPSLIAAPTPPSPPLAAAAAAAAATPTRRDAEPRATSVAADVAASEAPWSVDFAATLAEAAEVEVEEEAEEEVAAVATIATTTTRPATATSPPRMSVETPRVLRKARQPIRQPLPPATPATALSAGDDEARFSTPSATAVANAAVNATNAANAARHTLVVSITNGCGAAEGAGKGRSCWGFFVRYSLLGIDSAPSASSASVSPSRAPRGEHSLWWDCEAALNTRARHSVELHAGQTIASLLAVATAQGGDAASAGKLVVEVVQTMGRAQNVVGTTELDYDQLAALFQASDGGVGKTLNLSLPILWRSAFGGGKEEETARAVQLDVRLEYSVAPTVASLGAAPSSAPQTTLLSTATTKERLLPRSTSLLVCVRRASIEIASSVEMGELNPFIRLRVFTGGDGEEWASHESSLAANAPTSSPEWRTSAAQDGWEIDVPVVIDAKFVQYVHHDRLTLEVWHRARDGSVVRVGSCGVPLRGILLQREGVEGWHPLLSADGAAPIGRVHVAVGFAQYHRGKSASPSRVAVVAKEKQQQQEEEEVLPQESVAVDEVEAFEALCSPLKEPADAAAELPALPSASAAAATSSEESDAPPAAATAAAAATTATTTTTALPRSLPTFSAPADPFGNNDQWHQFAMPWLASDSGGGGDRGGTSAERAMAPSLTTQSFAFAPLDLDFSMNVLPTAARSVRSSVASTFSLPPTGGIGSGLSWEDIRGGSSSRISSSTDEPDTRRKLADNLRDLDAMMAGLTATSPPAAPFAAPAAPAPALALAPTPTPTPTPTATRTPVNATTVAGVRTHPMFVESSSSSDWSHRPVFWNADAAAKMLAHERAVPNKTTQTKTTSTKKQLLTPELGETLGVASPLVTTFPPSMYAYAALVHLAFRCNASIHAPSPPRLVIKVVEEDVESDAERVAVAVAAAASACVAASAGGAAAAASAAAAAAGFAVESTTVVADAEEALRVERIELDAEALRIYRILR